MIDRKTELFNELRELVIAGALNPGHYESAISGLWYFRKDEPAEKRTNSVNGLGVAIVVQGAKILLSNGKEYRYAPGDFLLITRAINYESCICEASPEAPYISVAMQIEPELIVQTISRMKRVSIESPTESEPFVVRKLDERLLDAFVRYLRLMNNPDDRQVLAPLIKAEIAYLLLTSEAASEVRAAAMRRGDEEKIAKAIQFIRSNYSEKITVEEISDSVAMSPSHFAHRFKDVARVSPMKFLKQIRLEAARTRLLTEGERPSEVAYQVGYASPSHFSRDFRDRFGYPPGEYSRTVGIQ